MTDVTYRDFFMMEKEENYQKYINDCLYAVCSVHFWINAEGKTMYIHFENTHRIEEVVHQNSAVSIWHPDISRASVY